MIANYLKILFRVISRQKAFAFINILGLSIGLVGFILIFLFVRYELSYDKTHEKLDRLYIVVRDVHYNNDVYHFTPTPYPFKDVIVSEFPEIEKATRLDEYHRFIFKYNDLVFDEPVLLTDKEIFEMLTFQLLEGTKGKEFTDKFSIAISKSMAQKYFPNTTALGKTFQVNGKFDFTVTAVYDNFPPNSSFRYDIIMPFEFLASLGTDLTQWGGNSVNVHVLLREGTDVKAFEEKLKPRLAKEQPRDQPDELFLHPYKDYHLHNFRYKGGAIQMVYIFSIVAVIILVLACINYVNLVTARSIRRAKEIGIRKTIGAVKNQVVMQFLGESVLLVLISLNFAVLLVELLLPLINSVIGKELSIEYSNPLLLLSLVGFAVATGLLAGAYPAFYLAGFSPSSVLKSAGKVKGGSFKSVLVVVQFTVSIALIITSLLLFKQFEYLRHLPIGLDKDNIVYFKLEDETREHFETLRKEFAEIPEVSSVTAASHLPTEIFWNGGGFNWEGKNPDQDVLISFTQVHDDYLKTFNIPLTEGRFFKPGEFPLDTINNIMKVVVNQRLVDVASFVNPIGKSIQYGNWKYEIIGVVQNFNFVRLRDKEGPLIMYYQPSNVEYGFVKVNGDPKKAIKALEKRYTKAFPQFPANFKMYNERFETYLGRESKIADIFGYFTLLAIIISCLGLYGLASFIAEQRRKEIGIRKALGANTSGLSMLLLKDFGRWILIANIIAIPLAWYYADYELSKAVFRTNISWSVFIGAAAISIIVASATVIFQVIKTAKENPADVLKYE